MKKIMLLLICILLSGCTAQYTLTYEKDIYKESFSLEDDKDKYYDSESVVSLINQFYSSNISTNYLDDPEELAAGENLSNYNFYTKSLIDKNGKYGIYLGYNFKEENEFKYSFLANQLFETININDNLIQAKNIKNIYDSYPYLKDINIVFKTDKIIENTNADKVEKNTYYWFINKDNYKNKIIDIRFNKNKNDNNTFIENGYLNFNAIKYIILILILILFIIVFVIYKKIRNSNK